MDKVIFYHLFNRADDKCFGCGKFRHSGFGVNEGYLWDKKDWDSLKENNGVDYKCSNPLFEIYKIQNS